MACPHVAGIAALWAESNPEVPRAGALAGILMARARALPFPANQVGKGLVQHRDRGWARRWAHCRSQVGPGCAARLGRIMPKHGGSRGVLPWLPVRKTYS